MNNCADTTDKIPSGQLKNGLLRQLLQSPFRFWSVGIVVAEAAAAVLFWRGPVCQRNLIDALERGDSRAAFAALALLALLLAGGGAGRGLAVFCRGRLAVSFRQYLKKVLFRHLLALPEDFLRSRGAGYFFNRLEHDISESVNCVHGGGLSFFPEILRLFLALGTVAAWCPSWLPVIVIFLLLQLLMTGLFRRRQYDLAGELQEHIAQERQLMQDFLSRHRTVKTTNAAQTAQRQLDNQLSLYGQLMRRKLGNEGWFRLCSPFPAYCGLAVLAAQGLTPVLEHQMTLGKLWSLLLLSHMSFAPVRNLARMLIQTQTANSAWHRLLELYRHPAEPQDSTAERVSLYGDIEFRQVDFSYLPEHPVLRKFDLTVKAGSGVFIIGNNGSGKSTLLSLLLRLYPVSGGQILVNDTAVENYPLTAYREQIGYIGQHPEFRLGTLRDNLTWGHPVDDEQIFAVFRRLNCESWVRRLGLDYPVSENGDNFSGGERLRLVLARELLRQTPILLCDEAAAHLDPGGREDFYRLLGCLAGEKTVLAVVQQLPPEPHWPVCELQKLPPDR